MILAVRPERVTRRLKGRLPAVGHVPGAGVDGHGDLLAGGHGVGTVAITQSERTLGCCALRIRSLPTRCDRDLCQPYGPTALRSVMCGRYRPCHLMGFSRGADERLQAAGGCKFAGSSCGDHVIRGCARARLTLAAGRWCEWVRGALIALWCRRWYVPRPGCGRPRRTPRARRRCWTGCWW